MFANIFSRQSRYGSDGLHMAEMIVSIYLLQETFVDSIETLFGSWLQICSATVTTIWRSGLILFST